MQFEREQANLDMSAQSPASGPAPLAPSGEQIEIVHGGQRAVVVEVGGALRGYEVGDWAVLDGYERSQRCTAARGQSLIPWPNRLRDGLYRFEEHDYQLALSEPAKGNAIHGLVRFANWTVAQRERERVMMAHVLHPQPGYPFALSLTIEYVLSDAGLTVTTSARNVGTSSCPYGAGAHPYLSVGTDVIDAAVLKIPANRWLPSDARGIPTGVEPVAGTPYDFRQPRAIGDAQLDTGYTDLIRDPDGHARVTMQGLEGQPRVALCLDESYGYVMAFTGDSLPEPGRRRRGLGVEPMTCAPNAFQTGHGLRSLAPGESCVSRWGLEPDSSPGPPAEDRP